MFACILITFADLSKKINPAHLNPDTLVGKYIPNLIAQPFDVSREYAQIIYDRTSSPRLDKVLKNWEEEKWGSSENRQKLAYVILVELLAYQFASPVRWIETQDLLFTDFAFERLVELGPGPTLIGMATRTLKAKYEASDDSVGRKRAILCHAKHPKEIYYQFEDEPEDAPATEPASDAPAAPSAAPAPVAAPSGLVASVEDVPIKPVDVLAVMVAQKLKKTVNEVPLSKSIKDLVGASLPFRTRFSVTCSSSSHPLRRRARSCPLRNLVRPCSPAAALASTLPASFLVSSAARCLVASTLPLRENTSRQDGVWVLEDRTALCCWPSQWSPPLVWVPRLMPRLSSTMSPTSTPPALVSA